MIPVVVRKWHLRFERLSPNDPEWIVIFGFQSAKKPENSYKTFGSVDPGGNMTVKISIELECAKFKLDSFI